MAAAVNSPDKLRSSLFIGARVMHTASHRVELVSNVRRADREVELTGAESHRWLSFRARRHSVGFARLAAEYELLTPLVLR
jgi:hypothetical protein